MSISRIFITCVVFSVAGLPSCFSADQLYEKCLSALRCGSESQVWPNITYPFWGDDIEKPNFCGQTEFKLSCKKNQSLTLAIGNRTLAVVSANLENKTIRVADESLLEGGCPMTLNFNGKKQFLLDSTTEMIDLYDCSRVEVIGLVSTITCGHKTYHVFRPSNPLRGCNKAGEIPMLGSAKIAFDQSNGSDQELKMALEEGFDLRYNLADTKCPDCSSSGGICGSESMSESFLCLCADRPHNSSCNDTKG